MSPAVAHRHGGPSGPCFPRPGVAVVVADLVTAQDDSEELEL